MMMWYVIMWTTLVLTGIALVYVSNRVCRFECVKKQTKDDEKIKAMIGGGTVFGTFALISIWLNFMNAIVCIIYFALAWLVCDAVFYVVEKIRKQPFKRYYAGAAAIMLSLAALLGGWYAAHHAWATHYTLTTAKLARPLKIALFADSHLGTTFDAAGLAEHLDAIQAEKPDILFIVGDFVDDDTTRENMVAAAHKFGELDIPLGTYFVFGNHDKGYYGADRRGFSGAELVEELRKNGVDTVRDEAILIENAFYIIGRRDASVKREQNGQRRSMQELTQGLDKRKYIIVADHQPADYAAQAESGVDLVLSGHTHGGQLFPFNNVGKWIGANDAIYGHEKRNNTDFIVTSGISAWAIKFKTGTKSEFVIIDVMPKE